MKQTYLLATLLLTATALPALALQKAPVHTVGTIKNEVNTEKKSIPTTPKTHETIPVTPNRGHVGINLSLWKKIATQPNDSIGSTFFNLGFLSTMNRLNGPAINILGSTVRHDLNGVQLSGIFNVVGENMRGVQIAGITNVNGNGFIGVSASGLVNISGNSSRGMLISGLANITGDECEGLVVSGLMNITGERSSGVQLSGLANIAGANFNGIMASGLLNVVGENLHGLQVSALGNITGGSLQGLQLSGFANIAGEASNGVQLSPVNFVGQGRALQIGLVNYYKDHFNGLQLGLVNANPDTKVQLMLFGGNNTKLNAGVRFKNQLFYTILGAATHYLDFNNKISGSLFYRAGLELPLYKKLFISGDLGYQHIELFKNKDHGYPARLYSLQGRVNLEYRLTNAMGVFITGGYGVDRYYNKDKTYDKGILLEGGIILFKY